MLRDKTTIVIGAGAGKVFDMPAGDDLIRKIEHITDVRIDGSKIDGNSSGYKLWNFVIRNCPEIERDIAFRSFRIICEGVRFSESIDAFLETHLSNKDLLIIGKLAIAMAIAESERRSKLWVDESNRNNTINFKRIENTWIANILKILSSGLSNDKICNIFDDLVIINFNYDRCIEHFFYYALQKRFSVAQSEAGEVLSSLRMLRPYGSLGAISRVESTGARFGAGEDLNSLASGISIYSEPTGDLDRISAIRAAIAEAETLIFIGFAFHPQNVRLLRCQKDLTVNSVYATAYGISEAARIEILNRIRIIGGDKAIRNAEIITETADKFLTDYFSILMRARISDEG